MRFKIEDINLEGMFTGEVNNLPSMVEPCHNPTISEMLLHPELMIQRSSMYDKGDSLEDITDPWDDDVQTTINGFSELVDSKRVEPAAPSSDGANMPNEGKDAPENFEGKDAPE